MAQYATWYEDRPRPRPHCVTWEPSPLQKKDTAPNFPAHFCCDQTVGWIKMPLGTEVGLGPGHFVLDGDPAPAKGYSPPIFGPCLLWPTSWVDQDTTWYRGRPRPRPHCATWRPSSPSPKGGTAPMFGPCLL